MLSVAASALRRVRFVCILPPMVRLGRVRWAAALACAASFAAAAQTAPPIARIGYLSVGSATATYTRPLEAFKDGLRELGWVEGRNVRIEYRFAEGHVDRLPALAEE